MSKTKFLVYWNPYEENITFSAANLFVDLFQNEEHVVAIDLKNNKDPRSLMLLREADLVVVFFKQNEFCLNRYFAKDLIRNENIIYVIKDFIYDGTRNWRRALERYRIPENQLFILPFDHRVQMLDNFGNLNRFVEEQGKDTHCESSLDFSKCFKLLRERIHHSLE